MKKLAISILSALSLSATAQTVQPPSPPDWILATPVQPMPESAYDAKALNQALATRQQQKQVYDPDGKTVQAEPVVIQYWLAGATGPNAVFAVGQPNWYFPFQPVCSATNTTAAYTITAYNTDNTLYVVSFGLAGNYTGYVTFSCTGIVNVY